MSARQYISTTFFNPLSDYTTLDEVTARFEHATPQSDTWWQCVAWYEHSKTGEWPEWITEYGEVSRGILHDEMRELYPDHPELAQNPDAPPKIKLAVRLEILYEQEGRCAECGVEEWRLKRRLDAHRIKPGKLGGKYDKDNVRLLCPKCHRNAPEHVTPYR